MRFVACGDSLFSSKNLVNRLDPKLIAYLKEADGVFTNAEFCTPRPETPPAPGRGYMTSVRADRLDEFVEMNIRLVSFVNNHSGDYGWQGVMDTIHAAEERKLVPCGLGRNLLEARLPRFLDTAAGRIGVVAAGSTRSEVFAASDEGAGVAARPGVNPLRWKQSYVLPEREFEELRRIDTLLGTKASVDEGNRIETFPPSDENHFQFGSLYEGNLKIEKGDRAYVRTFANEKDAEEIRKSVRDASRRADLTVFSLHTHEGVNENWYSTEPPAFIESICHQAIDAGADTVIGHGAHFMRGVEIYKGKPIFYNLGSLLMEFEAGESIIAPEMYESYGYDPGCRPSDLHGNRVKDREGHFIGFASERRFSENAMVLFDKTEEGMTWKMIPLDLKLDAEQPLKRGLPTLATPEVVAGMAKRLQAISAKYGTQFVCDETDGSIRCR
ncbi:MAG: CapA family protein [Clostridiales bacterium]|nr:CapA family protein [Clostridiales bacterium]